MKQRLITGLFALCVIFVLLHSGSVLADAKETESGKMSDGGFCAGGVIGGWTICDEIITPSLTEDSGEVFEKAEAGFTGIGLEPAALLATQVVAGKNYLFLCRGYTITENPVPGWYFTVVYQDLDGNAKITDVQKLDLTDLKTEQEKSTSNLLGGWKIMPASNAVTLPEKEWFAFAKASGEYTDVTLSPLALLATQVVAGENCMVLCRGTGADEDPADGIYVSTMYINTEGDAEITDVQQLDLPAYLQ